MTTSSGWDADAAARRCPVGPWSGTVWRAHRRRYAATDPGGSLRLSGRYNRGLDLFPPEEAWPALYLALSRDICLAEIVRHLTPVSLPALNDYRLSELQVTLRAVLDARRAGARDPTRSALPRHRLSGPPGAGGRSPLSRRRGHVRPFRDSS